MPHFLFYCIIIHRRCCAVPNAATPALEPGTAERLRDFLPLLPQHQPTTPDARMLPKVLLNINTSLCHLEVAIAQFECAATAARDHPRARLRVTHQHGRLLRQRNTPGPVCFAELVHMQVAQHALQHLVHHHARAGRDGARVQRLVGRGHDAAVTAHRATRAEHHSRACFIEISDAPRLRRSR